MSSPILFSRHFGINPSALEAYDLLDPFVEHDNPLFIDPLLLRKSTNALISTNGFDEFTSYFENVIRLLTLSEKRNDVAWKAAENLLSLKEPPENGLGSGLID